MDEHFKLGSRVRDTITGFSGVATARTVYVYGSPRVLVEVKVTAEGKLNSDWFEESRLEATE